MEEKKKRRKKILLIVGLLSLVVAIGVGALMMRNMIFKPFELEEVSYIYIDKNDGYEDVINKLKENNLPSEKVFRLIADRMRYSEYMKTGRYEIRDGMTMLDVIRMLRSGNQSAVNLTFNNLRTKENIAGRISQQLMMDSVELLNSLNDSMVVKELGFDEANFISMFIPNTYQVFWDTDVASLLNRMKREYKNFWNDNRLKKAEAVNLTPLQVSVLASIVEEEATYADEYPIVAGLYLNRLKRGMRLEADPTVKFAVGDVGLRRILFRHLEVESPYNTYKIDGLPPGPIRVPSVSAIDAVLSPTNHNYIFMCAKEDLSGRHNFAVTHAEHSRNASRYQSALNQMRIYK